MIDSKLILNVLLALFAYNIIFKAIGQTLMNAFLRSEVGKEQRKTFRERVREKTDESEEKP